MSQTSAYPPGTYESDPSAPWNQKENPHPILEDAIKTIAVLTDQLNDIRDTIGHRDFDLTVNMGLNQMGPLSYLDKLEDELRQIIMTIEDGEW